MNKSSSIAFALCLFTSLAWVQADQLFITTPSTFLPEPSINISIFGDNAGDTFALSLPDLTQAVATIGNDTQLFFVSPGDFLSNNTRDSFPVAINNSASGPLGEIPNNLPSLPLGESYLGFGVAEPVNGNDPFRTIGWARVLRTAETLEILACDSVSGSFGLNSDDGILVPVPEPSSALLMILAFCFAGVRRRFARLA